MQSYLKRLTVFLLLQAAVGAVVWCFALPPEHHRYLAALSDKHAALVNRPGPRLILVGGSSTAFGICSGELKQQLKLEPINMGAHISTGLDFMLRHVEPYVRAGDVVVLTPETQALCSPLLPEPKFVAELLLAWPEAADYLAPEAIPSWYVRPNWKDYSDRMALQELGTRVHEFWRLVTRGRKQNSAVYFRDSFNEYGDMIGHYSRPSTPFGEIELELDTQHLHAAIERMNRFAEHCRQRGASVYFAYGPMESDTLDECREDVQLVDDQVTQRLEMSILNRPEEVAYPRDHFFDTALHLTHQGAQRRTQLLVERLNTQLTAARPQTPPQ